MSGGPSLVEVGGWLGRLCEAQRGDRTCAAWKTVLGRQSWGGPGEGLRVGSFGKSGTIGRFVGGAGWFGVTLEVGNGVVE